jgi:hypothetical protein
LSVDDLLHPQLAYAPCLEDRDLGTHLSWVLRRSNYNFWIDISESRNYEISSKKVQTSGPVMHFCRDVTMVYHFLESFNSCNLLNVPEHGSRAHVRGGPGRARAVHLWTLGNVQRLIFFLNILVPNI